MQQPIAPDEPTRSRRAVEVQERQSRDPLPGGGQPMPQSEGGAADRHHLLLEQLDRGGTEIGARAELCEEIDRASAGPHEDFVPAPGVPADAMLYIKSRCGFSRATLLAMENLHLMDKVRVCNITDDPAAKETLLKVAGKETAPCLVVDGTPMHESKDIIRRLVDAMSPL